MPCLTQRFTSHLSFFFSAARISPRVKASRKRSKVGRALPSEDTSERFASLSISERNVSIGKEKYIPWSSQGFLSVSASTPPTRYCEKVFVHRNLLASSRSFNSILTQLACAQGARYGSKLRVR